MAGLAPESAKTRRRNGAVRATLGDGAKARPRSAHSDFGRRAAARHAFHRRYSAGLEGASSGLRLRLDHGRRQLGSNSPLEVLADPLPNGRHCGFRAADLCFPRAFQPGGAALSNRSRGPGIGRNAGAQTAAGLGLRSRPHEPGVGDANSGRPPTGEAAYRWRR